MDVRNICIMEKLKFDRFKGGCYTPHTHAAIDRTLTTILISFPMKHLVPYVEATGKKNYQHWMDG